MPDGTVVGPSCQDPPTTWVYSVGPPDKWTQGNKLINGIVELDDDEIGPGLLRYDGTAFFLEPANTPRSIRRLQIRLGATAPICLPTSSTDKP